MNRLVVMIRLSDEFGDFRRNHGHVAADISVVSDFDEPADIPPVPARTRPYAGTDQQRGAGYRDLSLC